MLPSAAANANMAALALGALSLSFCLFTPARVKRYLPGSLLALVVGTLSAVVLKLGGTGLHAHQLAVLPLNSSLGEQHLLALVAGGCQPCHSSSLRVCCMRCLHSNCDFLLFDTLLALAMGSLAAVLLMIFIVEASG